MIKNIVIVGLILLFSLNSISGTSVLLNHTDNIGFYSETVTDNLNTYQLFTDNQFSDIVIRQMSAFSLGTYYTNTSFQISEREYTIKNTYEVTTTLIPGVRNVKHTYEVFNYGVSVNGPQIYEFKCFAISASVFKSKLFFGTYDPEQPDKIYIEHYFSEWLKQYRSFDYICDIPNGDMSNIQSVNITKNTFSSVLLEIDYRADGTYPVEYYTDQLCTPLQWMYKGLRFIDSDNTFLNIMLVTQYTLNIILWLFTVIAQSFFVLMFIFVFTVIPFIAFAKSRNQGGFVDNLFTYYQIFFNMILKIFSYIINLIMDIFGCIKPF